MQITTPTLSPSLEVIVRSHLGLLVQYKRTLFDAWNDPEYLRPESALRAPFDTEAFERIARELEPMRTSLKTIILVGIGGSDMGTEAVYDALHNSRKHEHAPTLISVSTIEYEQLSSVIDQIKGHSNPKEIALVVACKSGTTTETIYNANILYTAGTELFGKEAFSRQTIVISDKESPLHLHAKEYGLRFFPIPKQVGGRFSIFTAVGCVPLYLLGFDVRTFLLGAQTAIKSATDESRPSSAGVLAATLFEAYLSEQTRVHEFFIWNPKLHTLGSWYRQLLAESLGKEQFDGTRIGITPTIATGTTDLHSVGQLIFGGRNDRFTTFVSVAEDWNTDRVYAEPSPFALEMLRGKKGGDVLRAIYDSVIETYVQHELSCNTIMLDTLNERELGSFMALHLVMIMYLGHLFDVNTFDQPAVELYKKAVRTRLTSSY